MYFKDEENVLQTFAERLIIFGSFLYKKTKTKLTTRWDQSLCAFSLNLPCIVIFSFNKSLQNILYLEMDLPLL